MKRLRKGLASRTGFGLSAMLRSLIILSATIAGAFAQVSTGTITGTVHDSTGAVIVGAKVTITQTATAEQRESVSNDKGEFTAPYLHIGEYAVSVAMTGFKTQTTPGVVLQVNATVTAIPVRGCLVQSAVHCRHSSCLRLIVQRSPLAMPPSVS